jgi:pimeloyl-ACP methyl ester carboxylesterase
MITTETTRTGSRAGRGGRVRRLRCCSPPAGFYAPGGAGVVRAGVAVAGMGPAAAGPRAPRVYRAGLASSIHWRNCGVRLDCARVQVPLDWARPAGPKITLEGIRHRASRPGRRIGTLFNPGGPGSSGVDAVKDPFTARLLDQAGGCRFDVVSWDPRGAGASTHVTCFRNEESARRF